MTQSPFSFAEAHRTDNLDHLIEFLRIPSISTSPEYRPDIDRAADWLAARMQAIGFDRAEVVPTGGPPIAYGEWLKAGPGAPTLLIYGHYDVQPTDPDDEWLSPPFEPVVRNSNLYGRGTSDDKGQLYTHLAAAEAFLRTQGALPVNLKLFAEGEEEVGSSHLSAFVQQYLDRLACDAVLISDTGFLDARTPAIVTGVRGLVYVEVEIQGPKADLHSGTYGGVAHNPLQVTADMLAALHDAQGRVAIPGFYDKVRPLSDRERAEMRRIPFDEEAFRRDEVGAPALWSGETGYTILERLGARPTLEIHGIRGGFVAEGQKTVIPAKVVVKVSMRLVPDQEPLEIARLFTQRIQQLAPPTVKVEVRTLSYSDSAVVDLGSPAMQVAAQAYREGFGVEPVFLRMGGSIPVVPMLDKLLRVPVILMGFGLPDDNLHSPNEKLSLDHFYHGITASIHFMQGLAARRQ
jgi:acetylornithine deacetylase/succinyl-diaminopimelate desuccinylase-like protein